MSPTRWELEPWCVYGGWRIAWVRWILERGEDWVEEYVEFTEDGTVYATQEGARATIERIRKS